jgi:beta-glucanase (GH16 family)
MKKIIIVIVLAGLFIAPALGQNPPQDKNWEVVFQDDFNTFNTQRWLKQLGPGNPGAGIGEGVPFRTYENILIENGKLILRVSKENHVCVNFGTCRYSNRIHSYTSGGIQSCVPYHYGYYEMYAKLPSCYGFSPGWMFHDSKSSSIDGCWYNEINLIEVNTCRNDAYDIGIHAHFGCPLGGDQAIYNAVEYTYGDGYHWYGLEWDRDYVTWYLDRKAVKRLLNSVNGNAGVQHPMYIHLGIALSETQNLPWTCAIPTNTQFPKDMLIDQVNAYRLKCDKNTVVNEIINYNTFSYAVKKSISLSSLSSLSSGKNVTLRATDFIELKSGFEVPLGAELYLDINPCE